MQLVGIQIYNLDIARIKNERNEILFRVLSYITHVFDFRTNSISKINQQLQESETVQIRCSDVAQKDM